MDVYHVPYYIISTLFLQSEARIRRHLSLLFSLHFFFVESVNISTSFLHILCTRYLLLFSLFFLFSFKIIFFSCFSTYAQCLLLL